MNPTSFAASLALAAALITIPLAHAAPPAPSALIPAATSPIAAITASATSPAEVVTTAPVSPAFKGWVHSTFDTPSKPGSTAVTSNNTITGAYLGIQKSSEDTRIVYQNPKTSEYTDYHSSTDLIRIGTLSPDSAENITRNAAALPIDYAAAIAPLRQLLGHEPTGITHTTDQGLDRYDFTAPREAAKKVLQTQGNGAAAANDALFDIPTAIWIDPATHLTQRAIIYSNNTVTYTYGGPDVTSIYDAGAPKNANVFDNRPTPQTVAVLNRAANRASTPLPDGVSVTLHESEGGADIIVHAQSKNHWEEREYSVRSAKPNGYTIELPNDWATTGADVFFRRMANTASRYETDGTDSDVYFRDFSPHTPTDELPKKYPDGSSMTIIYQEHYTGRAAASDTRVSSPANNLFTLHLSGQFSVDNHISLITDPQRPGLIGIRSEQHREASDSLRGADEVWLDPAHGERMVQRVEESFENPPPPGAPKSAIISSTGRFKTVTDYSDYATLPDGREYAGTSITISYEPQPDGSFEPADTRSTTFHFFPNRTLPPLKIPATEPANLP